MHAYIVPPYKTNAGVIRGSPLVGLMSRIKLTVRLPEDQHTYLFYVSGIHKPHPGNPNKGLCIKGEAAYWNHVPMGHGESYEGRKQATTVTYDAQTCKGVLILEK